MISKTANIYISGPVTGMPDYNRAAFHKAWEELAIALPDCVVINPTAIIQPQDGWDWSDYMREDLHFLLDCDTIYMLKGWQNSKGAVIEHNLAVALGYIVIYEEKPMDEEKQNMALTGSGYRLEIEQNEDGMFGYDLFGPSDNLILCGGDFETYDDLIEEMSELNAALGAIFG